MDVATLGPIVQRLFQAGLAASTQRVYASGKRKYLEFCKQFGVSPVPVSEQGLVSFVASMVKHGLKHATIKSYLSAVRHLQVSVGGGDPGIGSMPQLGLIVCGVKKEQVGVPKQTRLPITPAILRSPAAGVGEAGH